MMQSSVFRGVHGLSALFMGSLLFTCVFLCVFTANADIHVAPEAADAYHKARQLQDQGDLNGAEKEYLNAVAYSPQFPHALSALADVWLDMGRLSEAEQGYIRTLQVFPAWFTAANSLGFLYMNQGRMSEAVKVLRNAVASAPDSIQTRLNLGVMQVIHIARLLEAAWQLPVILLPFKKAILTFTVAGTEAKRRI
eukprot:2967394-Rhodomonas_salina.2